MSIPILNDVYNEVRRLSIAGSVVAPGDFRLKKLVDPLRKMGEKAPVFSKMADCAEQVIQSTEKTAAPALLELGSLVTSVLYTQGSTGADGTLKKLPPSSIAKCKTQTSARLLKPLLEALSTSGSGRLEQIKTAYEMNLFHDLRLIRASLLAVDDPYTEIRDFICDKVLPLYGAAIYDELRDPLDLKGKGGHCSRLKAMHRIAPEQSREVILRALEEGSKEIKMVAIECLGDSDEDLNYLLEQSRARSADVRGAAMISLGRLKRKEAEEVLIGALDSKDIRLLLRTAAETKPPALLSAALDRAKSLLASLSSLKDKAAQKESIERLLALIEIVGCDLHKECEKFLTSVVDAAALLQNIKTTPSGSDVLDSAVRHLCEGGKASIKYLVQQREQLEIHSWNYLLPAARRTLTPAEFFKTFSVYIDPKAKKNSVEQERSQAVMDLITDRNVIYRYYYNDDTEDTDAPLDPKWLDLAIESDIPPMVFALSDIPNKKLHQYLSDKVATKKSKKDDELDEAIAYAMIRSQHPAAESFIVEKLNKLQSSTYTYRFYFWSRIASKLSESAIPQLEALIANPKTHATLSDGLIEAIQKIRERIPHSTSPS